MKQAIEMAQLRRPPNRLTSEEYELYNLGRMTWREKTQFLGGRSGPAVNTNNDLRSNVLAKDKLISYGILRFHDFPFPDIKAIGHPTRGFPGAVSLRTAEEVAVYLETQAQFPLFMKPIAGNAGAGSIWVEGCVDGMMKLRSGTEVEVKHYFEKWLCREGILIQAAARPHPELAFRIGPRLATARVALLVTENETIIHRAALRIPAGKNMIDNFRHGASGNLLAAVETDSGVISNVIAIKENKIVTVPKHPDTGEDIIGFTIPDWERAKEMCIRAAPLFPGIMYQSWDIAFTDQGPQTIEVNSGGDVDVLQLASGRGVADANWWKLLREPTPRSWFERWFTRRGPWNKTA